MFFQPNGGGTDCKSAPAVGGRGQGCISQYYLRMPGNDLSKRSGKVPVAIVDDMAVFRHCAG